MNAVKKKHSVNIITRRMKHHAQASGYNRLSDYLDVNVIYPIAEWKFYQRAIVRTGRFLIKRSGSQWYQRDGFISEIKAAKEWFRRRGQVFHFLYGENSYRYLGDLKLTGDRNAIVCTYHTPKEKFNQIVRNKTPIKRLDGVIVVSTTQQEMFAGIISPERVHFIPHGIDVEFFKSSTTPIHNDICKCLCVGAHLRDFDVLVSAIKALEGKNIEITVVTPKSLHEKFTGLKNVRVLSGVDDDQLLMLYQSSDIFVMPVTDCTANNALLEAMACGLPIISTDLQGVLDYVNKDCAILTRKGDAQSLADAIIQLSKNESARHSMSAASRQHALTFAWEKIASQAEQLYESLGSLRA